MFIVRTPLCVQVEKEHRKVSKNKKNIIKICGKNLMFSVQFVVKSSKLKSLMLKIQRKVNTIVVGLVQIKEYGIVSINKN
jgi:hypothetical protein